MARPLLFLLGFVSASVAGCAKIYTLSADWVEGEMYERPRVLQSLPRAFSGVVSDAWCLTHATEGGYCLFDLPGSLAVDLLLLPYTAYQQVRHGNDHPRCVPEVRDEARLRNRAAVLDSIELCEQDEDRGIYNCGSMFAPDGTLLVDPSGGPRCPSN